jgi:hypothetical protein
MLDAGFVKRFVGYPTTRATSMLLILWLLDGDDVFVGQAQTETGS